MGRIRVVWGVARGPTALASYDAALAAADVHDYNLVHVSSVIPEGTIVERSGTAPDLGPVGGRLTVVEACSTIGPVSQEADGPERRACAGLGWARAADGRGVFYEAADSDPETVRRAIDDGLRAGCALREWSPVDRDRAIVSSDRLERTARSDRRSVRTDGASEPSADAGDGSDRDLRSGSPVESDGRYATAVVLAIYGESEPIL